MVGLAYQRTRSLVKLGVGWGEWEKKADGADMPKREAKRSQNGHGRPAWVESQHGRLGWALLSLSQRKTIEGI